jgi:carbon monoxide dehydrogenase subunit G
VKEQTLAINFSGEFTTPRSPEEVFAFLSDPNKFAPLLPDFQSMSMQDPMHFTVKVKVGVGNIRGSAELKMELSEAVKPLRAQYKGQGTAVGSQVTVSAGFDLSPLPESTRVVWQGETSVFGKLASMAGGMLEPLGRKNIQKLIDGLQKALAEPVAIAAIEVPIGEAPIPGPETVDILQSGMSTSLEMQVQGEISETKLGNIDVPQPGMLVVETFSSDQSNTTSLQVEAPGLSPGNPGLSQSAASTPAQNDILEGDHGNSDAPPNN